MDMKQRRTREKLEPSLSLTASSLDTDNLQKMLVPVTSGNVCTCTCPRTLRSWRGDQVGAGGAAGLAATPHEQGEPGGE